jgi:hypothetical protein
MYIIQKVKLIVVLENAIIHRAMLVETQQTLVKEQKKIMQFS